MAMASANDWERKVARAQREECSDVDKDLQSQATAGHYGQDGSGETGQCLNQLKLQGQSFTQQEDQAVTCGGCHKGKSEITAPVCSQFLGRSEHTLTLDACMLQAGY